LLDDKSINVAYDFVRGEGEQGRAKFRKGEDRKALGKGDCIDCKQCVNVCPMGIDIRNGIQMECTNCTACIDECNTIMTSVGLPKGLIRYASEAEMTKREPFKFTLRMKGYTAVLSILIGVLVGMLFLRSDVEVTLLRVPGQLYQHKGNSISNVYTFRAINNTINDYGKLELKLIDPQGTLTTVGKPSFSLEREGQSQGTVFIEIPEHLVPGDKTEVTVGLFDGERMLDSYTVTFMGPRVF
jgi:cytochrome c oxidase accessory protein FixG